MIRLKTVAINTKILNTNIIQFKAISDIKSGTDTSEILNSLRNNVIQNYRTIRKRYSTLKEHQDLK